MGKKLFFVLVSSFFFFSACGNSSDAAGDDGEEGIVYQNIAAMKAGSLVAGDACVTRGYYRKNDKGSSIYLIQDDSSLVDDGFTVITLNNGLKAVFVMPSNSVNIMAAGIRTGENISDRLNYVLKKTTGLCSQIVFNKGQYIIDKPVYLQSMRYVGTAATEFVVSQQFVTSDNKIFDSKNSFEASGETMKIEFYDITFRLESTSSFTMLAKETILVCLTGLDHCVIDNCKFIATQAAINGAYSKVDLLWFRDSSFKDITITNSSFENTTCQETGNDVTVGGEIWFWGGSYANTITDVTIKNCNFLHSDTDEVLAIWQCTASRINIDSCNFTVQTHHSDNIIALNDMYFSGVEISNCNFYINATCTFPIKTYKDFTAQLEVSKCKFYLNNGVKSPWAENISLFYFYNSCGDGETPESCYSRTDYSIDGCEVYSSNGTQYRTFLTPVNVSVAIIETIIDADFYGGVVWIENGFAAVILEGGSLAMRNNDLANIKSTTNLTSFSVQNCAIKQSVKLYLSGTVAISYILQSCSIVMQSQNYYLVSDATGLSGYNSSFIINVNTVVNQSFLGNSYGDLGYFTTCLFN